MSSFYASGNTFARYLLGAALVALLAGQLAWADHFHIEEEQNQVCSVCVLADNSPALAGDSSSQLTALRTSNHEPVYHTEHIVSPPSYSHRSRAPPAH